MTCNNTVLSARQPALFARVSAFVLLVFVTFGAIAGAAHNHGHATPQRRAGIPAPTVIDSGETSSSSKKLPKSGECLVCQLHQNLYSGLISALPHVVAPATQFAFATQNQLQIFSLTYAPRRGRAPPTFLS